MLAGKKKLFILCKIAKGLITYIFFPSLPSNEKETLSTNVFLPIGRENIHIVILTLYKISSQKS